MNEPYLKTVRVYKVILSTKTEIKLDAEEIQSVFDAIQRGGLAKVKQGVINPSYIAAIIEDEERKLEFLRQAGDVERHNEQDTRYSGGKNQKQLKGLVPLGDIFEGYPLRAIGAPKKDGNV